MTGTFFLILVVVGGWCIAGRQGAWIGAGVDLLVGAFFLLMVMWDNLQKYRAMRQQNTPEPDPLSKHKDWDTIHRPGRVGH
jgi:hypothetical protein